MIGTILKEILKEKNITVSELSKKTEVNAQTLYSIIKRNNMKVDFNVLLKICDALKVDIDIFYKDYLKNKEIEFKPNNQEKKLIESYRLLNDSGKEKAYEYVTDLSEQEKYTK